MKRKPKSKPKPKRKPKSIDERVLDSERNLFILLRQQSKIHRNLTLTKRGFSAIKRRLASLPDLGKTGVWVYDLEVKVRDQDGEWISPYDESGIAIPRRKDIARLYVNEKGHVSKTKKPNFRIETPDEALIRSVQNRIRVTAFSANSAIWPQYPTAIIKAASPEQRMEAIREMKAQRSTNFTIRFRRVKR